MFHYPLVLFFSRYYSNLNLTGDLVVCPLCYNHLTERYVDDRVTDDDDDDENDDDDDDGDHYHTNQADDPDLDDVLFSDHIDSRRDPIQLLAKCADRNVDGVKGCGHFLTTTIKKMRTHLIDCHHIRPKQMTRNAGCASLLATCKIRAADGLVQRHWRTRKDKRVVAAYWSGTSGCDRKSMYVELQTSTQKKEEEEEEEGGGEGEEEEQRSAWSVLGGLFCCHIVFLFFFLFAAVRTKP